MTWKPTDKEISTLVAEISDKRYEYFIHKVVDQRQVWSLRDSGGWRVVEDNAKHECVPVWPHPRYAELYATEEFQDSHPEAIPLDIFIERWLPGMEKDKRLVAVFPTPQNKGIVALPLELLNQLETEKEKYD